MACSARSEWLADWCGRHRIGGHALQELLDHLDDESDEPIDKVAFFQHVLRVAGPTVGRPTDPVQHARDQERIREAAYDEGM